MRGQKVRHRAPTVRKSETASTTEQACASAGRANQSAGAGQAERCRPG